MNSLRSPSRFSRMYLEVTGPPRRISIAARRLPSRVTARRCEMIASSVLGQLRSGDRSLRGGNHRQNSLDRLGRVRAVHRREDLVARCRRPAAPFACVSLSRSSPTKITSGSCRSACLRPCSNEGVSWPSSSCAIIAFWLVCTYSIGSSIVMILERYVRLMRSIIAASVVDLPLPVVPVSRVSPRSESVIVLSTSGSWRSSSVRILSPMIRITSAGVPMWL